MTHEYGKREAGIMIVVTTCDSRDEAVNIGREMVRKRLAACAQISGPIESHFWWDGKLDSAEEWQCRMKTTPGLYPSIEEAIKEIHSYEVPQIVGIRVSGALSEFESWVIEETEKKKK